MRTVFTNGCYDILHPGHLRLLEYARSLGDRLIVGLDTDARVKNSKGSDRPINTLADRMYMMKSIRWVSDVYSFNSDEELRVLLRFTEAKILVIGSDYIGKKVIGEELVEKVIFYDRIPKYSTTQIIKRIINR